MKNFNYKAIIKMRQNNFFIDQLILNKKLKNKYRIK